MRLLSTVRVVAVFEMAKGALVLVAGAGALSVTGPELQAFAERLVGHLHLNPAKHQPRIFIDAIEQLADAHLWALATMAAAYGLARFVEAYGLWHGRRWAEWIAAVSGGIYIPFELYELFQGDTGIAAGALVANGIIVGLMIMALRQSRTNGA